MRSIGSMEPINMTKNPWNVRNSNEASQKVTCLRKRDSKKANKIWINYETKNDLDKFDEFSCRHSKVQDIAAAAASA